MEEPSLVFSFSLMRVHTIKNYPHTVQSCNLQKPNRKKIPSQQKQVAIVSARQKLPWRREHSRTRSRQEGRAERYSGKTRRSPPQSSKHSYSSLHCDIIINLYAYNAQYLHEAFLLLV